MDAVDSAEHQSREGRGVSQILFGFLPGQTADLAHNVWRVTRWTDPLQLPMDAEALRTALLSAIRPWSSEGTDRGFAEDLLRRVDIDVLRLNPERGVEAELYPRIWRCATCGRITRSPEGGCRCGSPRKGQLPFVSYHSCGALDEPRLPAPCPVHHDIALAMPGTTRLSEMRFFCPQCQRTLRMGFIPKICDCANEPMRTNIHRSAAVYTPHYAVMVNPPDPETAARLRQAGGGARALEWVLEGMQTNDVTGGPNTEAGLIDVFLGQGLSEELARDMARMAVNQGQALASAAEPLTGLTVATKEAAQEEALSIAGAVAGGRVTITELASNTTPPLQLLYERGYPAALAGSGLEAVDFLPSFPVATVAFGYTRDESQPGTAQLAAFRERGRRRVYGAMVRTEALLFRIDPVKVAQWAASRGLLSTAPTSAREARIDILSRISVPGLGEENPQPLGDAVLTLVHSYAHRLIRRLSALAGVEREGLAEYLFPHQLAFVVYAAARSDFVLGGLQSVFETALDRLLDDVVNGERRCPLDPGCSAGGGACMACLHIGEPSCRMFNTRLDRAVLFGAAGYFK